jgi:hypothetical protein
MSRTFSSPRSYGKLATMTFVLDGTPSSGGPRCLRSRGTRGSRGSRGSRGFDVLSVVVASSAPFFAVSASFVVSVSGSTWAGTFVGPSAAASAESEVPLVAVFPLTSSACRRTNKNHKSNLRPYPHGRCDLHGPCLYHDHGLTDDGASRCHWYPLHRSQRLQRKPQACERAEWKPCDRGCSCCLVQRWRARLLMGWTSRQRRIQQVESCEGLWGWKRTRCTRG